MTVCLLTVLFVSCSKDAEEKKEPSVKYVKVLKVEAQSGLRTQSFPGMSQAVREVKLAFRVAGPLVRLPVDTGQYVKKGELIAEIDPRDYRVNVNTVKAQLNVLKAQLEESELQYNRYKNLYAQQAAQKSVYDRAKAGYESLKAQVEATAEKLQTAENALFDTKLPAPFPVMLILNMWKIMIMSRRKNPLSLFWTVLQSRSSPVFLRSCWQTESILQDFPAALMHTRVSFSKQSLRNLAENRRNQIRLILLPLY